jgi:hypothetical protein
MEITNMNKLRRSQTEIKSQKLRQQTFNLLKARIADAHRKDDFPKMMESFNLLLEWSNSLSKNHRLGVNGILAALPDNKAFREAVKMELCTLLGVDSNGNPLEVSE